MCFPVVAHDYMFKHLEVKDGLSNNQVNSIFKDSQGFMWFGTASGLDRYDGYNIKVYRNEDGNVKSLPDNYIEEIQEDASGQLWLHTGAGYVIYDPATDTFNRDVEAWMWNIGISGAPTSVYIDDHKVFWIYIQGQGVYRYKPGEESAVAVKSDVLKDIQENVTDMMVCEDELLLMYGNGILVSLDVDKLEMKWKVSEIAVQRGGQVNEVFTLFVDKGKRIWIYSAIGMWIYDLPTKSWSMRSLRTDNYSMVRALAQDKNGCIWIGKDQDGIELMERSGTTLQLMSVPGDARSLINNTVTALYEDEGGTMWVGTYKKGLSYYSESDFKFGFVEVGDINCVEDGTDGIVWLGTNDSGLIRWNVKTDERKVFMHQSNPNSISTDVIVCLLRARDGKLWAGTFWGGLNCYDGNRFIHYRTEKGRQADSNSLAHDNVWALAEDAEGNIWIGTLGGGLQCLNPKTGTFTTYTAAGSGLFSDYISSICMGRDETLIIGTPFGMGIMDLNTKKITGLTGTKSGKTSFTNSNINQVYEDSRGLIWIATREGLNVYDPKRDELYDAFEGQGFNSFFVLGITEDENKAIWVSAGSNLINVQLSTDSHTGKLSFRSYVYSDKDGLQNCNFNQRSLKRLQSTGEIVVGGLYGLNRFRPDNIRYNRALPKVMFTGLQLFGEDVEIGKEYGGRVVLRQSLNDTDEVVLDYKQNIFTVLFASDNYVLPDKTKYLYKLEGFNDDYMPGGADMHRVTYTNLAPGTYQLKVKAINSDGFAGTDEASLKIVILPPFWMTAWAYACYVLLLIAVLCLAYYSVQRRERNKFKIRQMEQDAMKNEEVNQMKFRFFTNVSHELRTPLTLIISPLESIIKETTDEKRLDKLKLMHRNALRLLTLVNQLLDFRKNEVAGLHLSLSEGDVVAYVRNICSSFLMLSEKKNVHLTFFSAIDYLNMAFDEDKVGKVVMNLLSNAFKFTPEGGRVDISIDVLKETPEMLEIKVSDTGIGISDENKERIFERFYQVEHEGEHNQSTGSGIGLSLVRDFVTLHGGTVRVFDNVGTGSVFVVDIPVKHNELSSDEPNLSSDGPRLSSVQTAEEALAEAEKEKPLALIVDDNEDLILFMKDALSMYFRVKSASNGREAWQLIPDLMPDIIVSDVMMPEMDGNELCRWVKTDKRTSGIPFILLTAKQAVEDKVEGLTIGADDYVTKPFNVEVLVLRMRKLIDLSRRNKQRTHIEPEPSEIVITSLDEQLVAKAIKYVEEHISHPDLSVEILSRELGMSRVQLYKKLLQITGKTPTEFIRIIRLKRAMQFLRESQLNVSEIAYNVGFNNPKYFTKYFKEEFGVLPSVFQEKEGR